MKLDRAEWTGTAAALLFHVALIGAMSLSLARIASVPEPPSMEVDLIEEVGLTSAAPVPAAEPQAAQSPTVEPSPEPVLPTPQPAVQPRPAVKPAQATPAKPPRPAPRAPSLGDDFLKGIPGGSATSAKPAAATVSASAMAGIQQAIRRQVQPCADRQVNPGPGASRIKVRMRLQLHPNGRLRRPPMILGTTGVDDDNVQYEERVVDLAVAIVAGCAPLTGLPPELYKTESGKGWSDFVMSYSLP